MSDFEALLIQHMRAAERWVEYHTSRRQDAEDILQETYLAAYQAFPNLRDERLFRAWLLGIARRKWADWYRSRTHRLEIPMDALPETAAADTEDGQVMDTLAALPERDRLMLRLFYLEQLSVRSISSQLSIPEGTVKSRLNKARARFRDTYPYPPRGVYPTMKSLPEKLPPYHVVWKDDPPFRVTWEELTGWFIVPRQGAKLTWGMYDLPSRKLDIAYEMTVTGPACVHGQEGVEIKAKAIQPNIPLADSDLMQEPVAESGADEEVWTFVAQLADRHTRFLSAERCLNGVRTVNTFLEGAAFTENWGIGENNVGNPIDLQQRGDILRDHNRFSLRQGKPVIDIVGRCELILDGQSHDTVCVMDAGSYQSGTCSLQFLNRDGLTLLWQRYNRDDWAVERYGKKWSELLPGNEQLFLDDVLYVHWYDCLCVR